MPPPKSALAARLHSLLTLEHQQVEKVIAHYQPKRLLWLGALPKAFNKVDCFLVNGQVPLASTFNQEGSNRLLRMQMDSRRLAFADETFDMVVLSHQHEFVNEPDALWLEVERVLAAEGLCVCFGLEWFWFSGMWRRYLQWKDWSPSRMHALSWKLKNWGLQTVHTKWLKVSFSVDSWCRQDEKIWLWVTKYYLAPLCGPYELVLVKRKESWVSPELASVGSQGHA